MSMRGRGGVGITARFIQAKVRPGEPKRLDRAGELCSQALDGGFFRGNLRRGHVVAVLHRREISRKSLPVLGHFGDEHLDGLLVRGEIAGRILVRRGGLEQIGLQLDPVGTEHVAVLVLENEGFLERQPLPEKRDASMGLDFPVCRQILLVGRQVLAGGCDRGACPSCRGGNR